MKTILLAFTAATCLSAFAGTATQTSSGATTSNQEAHTPPTKLPDISIQQPAGSELEDGASKKSFGKVKVGKKGETRTFTVKNTGSSALKYVEVALTGVHKKDFSVTAPSKASLPPGASTTFKVTFKPKTKGTRSAVLQVRSNDKDESPFDIRVTGVATK